MIVKFFAIQKPKRISLDRVYGRKGCYLPRWCFNLDVDLSVVKRTKQPFSAVTAVGNPGLTLGRPKVRLITPQGFF